MGKRTSYPWVAILDSRNSWPNSDLSHRLWHLLVFHKRYLNAKPSPATRDRNAKTALAVGRREQACKGCESAGSVDSSLLDAFSTEMGDPDGRILGDAVH